MEQAFVPIGNDYCDIYLDFEIRGLSFAFLKVATDGSPADLLYTLPNMVYLSDLNNGKTITHMEEDVRVEVDGQSLILSKIDKLTDSLHFTVQNSDKGPA